MDVDEAVIVELDQELSVVGFRDNVNGRQELLLQICSLLKKEINEKLDQYCRDLELCVADQRSYFSVAYWTGALPISELEILQMVDTGKEITQSAVDNTVNSFHERCTSKIPFIERAIECLGKLDPSEDLNLYKHMLDKIREHDRLIVENLTKSATWKNVLHIEDDGSLGDQF